MSPWDLELCVEWWAKMRDHVVLAFYQYSYPLHQTVRRELKPYQQEISHCVGWHVRLGFSGVVICDHFVSIRFATCASIYRSNLFLAHCMNHFVIVKISHHSRKDSVSTIGLDRVQSGKESERICQMSFACFATQHRGSLASCIRLLKLFVSIHTVATGLHTQIPAVANL